MSKIKLTSSSASICHVCGKTFTSKLNNLNKHLKDFHSETIITSKKYIKCLETDCDFSATQLKYLRSLLSDFHKIKQESETLYFLTITDFEQWKAEIEQQSNCSWSKKCGSNSSKNFSIYYCNRSGKKRIIGNLNRKTRDRIKGSCKLNFFCTSSIIVRKENRYILVEFYKTHYRHKLEMTQTAIDNKDSNYKSLLDNQINATEIRPLRNVDVIIEDKLTMQEIQELKNNIAKRLNQISINISTNFEYEFLQNVNVKLDSILENSAQKKIQMPVVSNVNQLILLKPVKRIHLNVRKIAPKPPTSQKHLLKGYYVK